MISVTGYKIHNAAWMRDWIHNNRVLILAVSISVGLHIFWLSVVKVVVKPPKAQTIKFSKVSFIGPVLDRGMFEVRIEPRERDFLEKRYMQDVSRLPMAQGRQLTEEAFAKEGAERIFSSATDGKLFQLIEDAVSASKLEPEYGA